jgi:hypothetical protein
MLLRAAGICQVSDQLTGQLVDLAAFDAIKLLALKGECFFATDNTNVNSETIVNVAVQDIFPIVTRYECG